MLSMKNGIHSKVKAQETEQDQTQEDSAKEIGSAKSAAATKQLPDKVRGGQPSSILKMEQIYGNQHHSGITVTR